MAINWFPGHMHKARKEIREVMPQIDIVIEVLDARIPFSSENPLADALRGEKPCIKVLNKSDLADPELTERWVKHLEKNRNVKAIPVTMEQPGQVKHLLEICRQMIPRKMDSTRVVRALIMGIPNVGKSTIINTLAGRTIAKTGNEPAVTKRQQRIDLHNGIILCDTPGMLWPNLENVNTGYRLATTGAIKDTALKHDDVASFAGEFLLTHYPEALKTRYQIKKLPNDDYDLSHIIGKKRGCLRAGGHVDMDKVAKILLAEIRDGSLGRLTLETPEMMVKELKALDIIRAKKAEKQEKRKKQWKDNRD